MKIEHRLLGICGEGRGGSGMAATRPHTLLTLCTEKRTQMNVAKVFGLHLRGRLMDYRLPRIRKN